MRFFRPPTAWTAAVAAIVALTSPIWNIEVEQFWLATIRPAIAANAWAWVVIILDNLTGFWGGVFITIAIFLAFDLWFGKRRGAVPQNSGDVMLHKAVRLSVNRPLIERLPSALASELQSMRSVSLTRSDLLPAGLALSGRSTNGECDVIATVFYRNRSTHEIYFQPVDRIFDIDGETLTAPKLDNVHLLRPTQDKFSHRLGSLRIYKVENAHGNAAFVARFGRTKDHLNMMLIMSYSFEIKNYPDPKYSEAPVQHAILEKSEKIGIAEE